MKLDISNLVRGLEKISRRFPVMLWILRIPSSVFTASFLHPDPLLSPQGLALLKSFVKWTLPSAVVLSYNMVLTTTSKPTFLPLSLFDYLSYY